MSQSSNETGSPRGPLALVWATALIIAALLAISYLIAVPVGLVPQTQRLSAQEIIFSSVIIITLILLVLAAQGITITDLTVGSSGISVKAHFSKIEKKQGDLEADVRALQVALTGLVTKFELTHLQKLAGDIPPNVRFGNIFVDQLTHLDAMGFVQPIDPRGINAIAEDHGSGLDEFDLTLYLKITREGREYLDLRNKLTQ